VITITDKSTCSGCHACEQACPKHCISMVSDTEGFLYPHVDMSLCSQCGLCEKTCPILQPLPKIKEKNDIKAYAAVNKNESIRQKSSSGGIFSIIAEYVLSNGGIVFGAAFDEKLHLRHIAVNCIEDLELLRGSKYLQSEISSAYNEAKTYLEAGTPVLFTGTPCQIAGLYKYLNKEYDNLLTQDIICHGVPSPMVWEKYIEFRETQAASKAQKTFFRNKKYGWKKFSVQFIFENCTEYQQVLSQDFYMRSFLSNYTLRPSCYECAFKNKLRLSDFTLADFWGIQKINPDLDDDKGVSLVVVNSQKAMRIWESLSNEVYCEAVDIDSAILYNSAMIHSAKMPKKRNAFMQAIVFEQFDKVVERYIPKKTLLRRIFGKLKRILFN